MGQPSPGVSTQIHPHLLSQPSAAGSVFETDRRQLTVRASLFNVTSETFAMDPIHPAHQEVGEEDHDVTWSHGAAFTKRLLANVHVDQPLEVDGL